MQWQELIELGGLEKSVENGVALATPVRAAEQPRLATGRHAAQRALGDVVRQANGHLLRLATDHAG
jgi:hypothetical protein